MTEAQIQARVQSVKNRIAKVLQLREAALMLYEESLATLKQRIVEIQFNCPHDLKKKNSDYTGEWEECEACGIRLESDLTSFPQR